MDKIDIEEFELDIQETFLEIGDTKNIALRRFIVGTPNIYKEQKVKSYGTPIVVNGRVRLTPNTEELSDIGRNQDIEALFTFVGKDLRAKGILVLNTLNADLNDRIVFKGTDYEIKNIIPTAMIGDRFLIYKFECRKVR